MTAQEIFDNAIAYITEQIETETAPGHEDHMSVVRASAWRRIADGFEATFKESPEKFAEFEAWTTPEALQKTMEQVAHIK